MIISLQYQLCHQIRIFVNIIVSFRSQRKENSAHGKYQSIKRFLHPVKLYEISIMMRSWNYNDMKCSWGYHPAYQC